MLLPQPASAFDPVSFEEAAVAKDKCSDGQEEAYNRDKRELARLAPDAKVRVQCEKTGFWDKIGTVIEIRPDKLSYLLDVEGKLLIRARFMIKPLEEGGVSDIGEVQDQGGAHSTFVPRRSERLQKKNSAKICAPQTTRSPNSGSSAVLTGSIESRWHKTQGISQPTTRFNKMPGDFPWSTFSGPASPLGRPPSLLWQSSRWPVSSVVGSVPEHSVGPSTAIPSSSPRLPPPLCQALPPLVQGVPSGQSRQMCLPPKLPSGSVPLQAGRVSLQPTCQLPVSCPPSSPFPSFRPSPRTTESGSKGIPGIQHRPRLISGAEKRCSTPVDQLSLRAPDSSSLPMSQSRSSSVNVLPAVPRRQSPPQHRPLLQPPGLLPGPDSLSFNLGQNRMEQPMKSSCDQSESLPRRKEQQECIQMNKNSVSERFFPAHSVKDYNKPNGGYFPGSVRGMKVYF